VALQLPGELALDLAIPPPATLEAVRRLNMRNRQPTSIEQSIRASIEIPDLQISYLPGDLVQGVVKKVNIENLAENVSVVLRIVVRIETEVGIESRSSDGSTSTSHYKGERKIIDVRQQVHSGPALPGINTWPFSIAIPQHPLVENLGGLTPPPEPLPPTFYRPYERITNAQRSYLFVEYFLEADIYQASGPRAVATFPLNVRPQSTAQPITDTSPQLIGFNESVKTLHLDPQYAEKDLSFRQHMQTIFKRSTLPKYSFIVMVEYPTVIQMEHSDPLSFKMRVVSIQEPGQTSDFLIKTPPEVKLVSARLNLQSATHVANMEGNTYKLTGREEGHWQDNYLVDWSSNEAKRKKAASPSNSGDGDLDEIAAATLPDESRQSGGAWFDMGAALGLRVSAHGVSLPEGQFPRPLYPSFATRHTTHAHQLRWRLVVAVAGRRCKIAGKAPVLLLGPSQRDEVVRAQRLSPDAITRSHRAWADGTVDLPVLAASMLVPEPLPPPVYSDVAESSAAGSSAAPVQKA
jgi:hypothetical protein